ncbi:hypothetical protein QQS21_011932 [Conoideocrella luteorostrata]|uniref:Uncharacterized protein n=1 Tax=Conoideocrella luteorostrata TaxID=1105319 RepID=A0AAJ0CCH2_9HYPO|nr:hypothetical protein QQS21_011932 [Conoideocrella luteorostrata]
MVRILEIPREIRDIIFTYALRGQRDPPSSPASLCGEGCTRHYRPAKRYLPVHRHNFVRFEKLPAMNTSLALQLVSRQIYSEMKGVMRREISLRPDYHLDLMYLTDGSIWSGWTSLPVLTQRVRTLYATFRLFDCPPELENLIDGEPYSVFNGGDGGPPTITWIFYDALNSLLNRGPWPNERTTEDDLNAATVKTLHRHREPGMVMDNLVIDVLTSLDPEILPLDCPSYRLDATRYPPWRFLFSRFTSGDKAIMELSEGEQAATQLKRFIREELDNIAKKYMQSYGELLYHRVGAIDIRLNGEPQDYIDLAVFPHLHPGSDYYNVSPRDKSRVSYAKWIVKTSKKRKEVGLPVAPLSLHQRTYLEESGVDYDA